MFSQKTMAVIKREIKALVGTKMFIVMTLLFPLLFLIIGIVPTLFMAIDTHSGIALVVVEESPFINETLRAQFEQRAEGDKAYTVEYRTMSRAELQSYLEKRKQNLLDHSLTGIVYIPDSARYNKSFEYYSANTTNLTVIEKLRSVLNNALVAQHFEGSAIDAESLDFARSGTSITPFRISQSEEIEEGGGGAAVLAFVFTFLLYISLLLNGAQMMRLVTEEKNSRVVEVLLSSISAQDLMIGKIVGAMVSGLLQMLIWLLPLIALAGVQYSGSGAAAKVLNFLSFSLDPFLLVYFIVNFLIGLLTYLGLFAAVGAMFENDQEAQHGMWPIMLLILIPFFINFSLINNPANPIVEICSLLPFASIMVMPARAALVVVPWWQMLLALLINAAVLLGVFKIAGKVYRIGILKTGQKATWSEVVKWLKYQY